MVRGLKMGRLKLCYLLSSVRGGGLRLCRRGFNRRLHLLLR